MFSLDSLLPRDLRNGTPRSAYSAGRGLGQSQAEARFMHSTRNTESLQLPNSSNRCIAGVDPNGNQNVRTP